MRHKVYEAVRQIQLSLQEKQGEIFQNLHPVRGEEKRQSSESSKVRLQFHTETAFHPERSDFLLLYCIRPDHDRVAQTTFASIHDVLPKLTDVEINILSMPLFTNRIDYSFHKNANLDAENLTAKSLLTPILFNYPDFPMWIYDEDMTEATTNEADNALQHLHAVVQEVVNGVALDVGDVLVVDNYRVVHGRSMFTPRYDGYDRWLQRSFVSRDLRRSASVRESGTRIINRDFSSWIKADKTKLAKGAIRPLD